MRFFLSYAAILVAALLATFLPRAAAQPRPPTAVAAFSWQGLDSLPAETREMIHRDVKQLPPFPHDNPGLLNPGRWPATSVDSSRGCVLELRVYPRGVGVAIRSLRQRQAGQALTARYLCAARGWGVPRYAGPCYVWNGRDVLEERSYRDTNGRRYREDLYQYRANGLAWAYRRRERNEDATGPWMTLDEYFDPDGRLAGFQLVRVEEDSVSVQWRRGVPVSGEVFRVFRTSFAH